MGQQLTFTAVEQVGESGVQELPMAGSSVTIGWSEWEAALHLLSEQADTQEELMAICPDEPDDPEAPSWAECMTPVELTRTLERARRLCGLDPIDERPAYRVVCRSADPSESLVASDPVALVAGDETLLLSVAKGTLTRIDRTKQSASSEPLCDGLEITGSPIGESRVIVARVEATGGGRKPTDALARALAVCHVARANRGRVHVTLSE